jgi:hypothetical protein
MEQVLAERIVPLPTKRRRIEDTADIANQGDHPKVKMRPHTG